MLRSSRSAPPLHHVPECELCGCDVEKVPNLRNGEKAGSERCALAIMEVMLHGANVGENWIWVSRDGLAKVDVDPHCPMVIKFLREFADGANVLESDKCQPWSRIGWMKKVKRWIDEELTRRGCHEEKIIIQEKSQFSGAVLRIVTKNATFYMKASTQTEASFVNMG